MFLLSLSVLVLLLLLFSVVLSFRYIVPISRKTSLSRGIQNAMTTTTTTTTQAEEAVKRPQLKLVVPANTENEYEQLILNNGIKVTLTHLPNSEKAAAALTVQCGAKDDPEDLPGLAHFTEHAVFLGSHTFPGENDFKNLLAKNGGSSNGGTGMESTSYQFQVNHAAFDKALEIWSHFFVDPLFTPDAIEREVMAVDAEDSKNRILDNRRMLQVLKDCIVEETSYKKFSTGNVKTLANGDASANRAQLTASMHAFYTRHYNPEEMALSLVGPQSLDELRALAVGLFARVEPKKAKETAPPLIKKSSSVSESAAASAVYPFKASVAASTLRLRPVKDIRDLTLYFPLPATRSYHKTPPTRLLSYLLSHKGEGSLFAVLQDKGWATATSTGERTDFEDFSLFEISATLTVDGLANYSSVVAEMYKHIGLVRGASDEELLGYWEEIRAIGEVDFAFQERTTAYQLAPFISRQMTQTQIPMHEILSEGWLLSADLDIGLVKSAFLGGLVPERALVTVRSREFAANLPEDGAAATAAWLASETGEIDRRVEPWYQTPYLLSAQSQSELEVWRSAMMAAEAAQRESRGALEGHSLPPPNPYVCTQAELNASLSARSASTTTATVTATATATTTAGQGLAGSVSKSGKKIRSDPPTELSVQSDLDVALDGSSSSGGVDGLASLKRQRAFTSSDQVFSQPRYIIHSLVHSIGHATTNPDTHEANMLGHPVLGLASSVFSQINARVFYPATMSGLSHGVSLTNRGLSVTASGYSPKLLKLFEDVTAKFGDMDSWRNISDGVVEICKERMLRGLRSWTKERPDSIADSYLNYLLLEEARLYPERIAMAESITRELLIDTIDRAMSRSRIITYVHGDQPPATATAALDLTARLVGKDMPLDALSTFHQQNRFGLPPSPNRLLRARRLPRGHSTVALDSVNPEDPNSALIVLFQTDTRSPATSALSIILTSLLREPAFNYLRTQRQLGYIVSMSATSYGSSTRSYYHTNSSSPNMRALSFRVLSQRFGPAEMQAAFDEFLVLQRAFFLGTAADGHTGGPGDGPAMLTETELKARCESVIRSLLDPPTGYEEEAGEFWGAILEDEGYDWVAKVIAEVRALTVEKVREAFSAWFLDQDRPSAGGFGFQGRRSVSVWIESAEHKKARLAREGAPDSNSDSARVGAVVDSEEALTKFRDSLPYVA